MKTVRELADEIGVSKVAVVKKIEKLNIKNDLVKKGNRLLIPDSVEYAVKVAFNYSNTNQTENDDKENENNHNQNDYISQTLIEMLRTELEEKNKQIEQLQTIINQEQQLRMVTERKLLAIEQKEKEGNENNEKKQGFWSRLFGTKPKENTGADTDTNTDTGTDKETTPNENGSEPNPNQ